MTKETAMKILKELHDKSLFAERTAIETIIPELKESEDEKIRKELIEALKRYNKRHVSNNNRHPHFEGIEVDKALAWLEKQGEQMPFDKVEPKFEDEIEIPFGAKDSELIEESYYIPKGFHAEIDDDKVVIKKGEKSAAWSEEDEEMTEDLIKGCISAEKAHHFVHTSKEIADWLISLKDRIIV